MEYHSNLSAVWKKLKGPQITYELTKRTQKAAQWASGIKKDLSGFSREIQMVPVYLELATYKGNPRFNMAQINEITGSVIMYKSEIPVTDLIKELLVIGSEKDNLLSAKEIQDFLSTTAFMNKKEQLSVIKFIKSLKENIPVNSKNNNNIIANDSDLIQYRAYTSKAYFEPGSISEFINLRNLEFVYGITRCKKPETLAKIAQVTGEHWAFTVIPNKLVQIYELSKGNVDLVNDLLRVFYPWEIEEIAEKLSVKGNASVLSKYEPHTSAQDYVDISTSSAGIISQRQSVISSIGLTGEIKLSQVESRRPLRIIDGSFEQGKRR